MKVNDIVLCDRGLAKISDIDDESVTVVYDFIYSKTYKIKDAVFLKNNAVEKIIQIHNANKLKQYELDSLSRKRLYHFEYLTVDVSEKKLKFEIINDIGRNEKISIDLLFNKITSDMYSHELSKGAINLLNFLYQTINCLQQFDVTKRINNDELIHLVHDFSNSYFDTTILNKIREIMKQKSFVELVAFCYELDEMPIKDVIKDIMFFLLQDTTNEGYRMYDIMCYYTNFVKEMGYSMITGSSSKTIEYVTYKLLSNNEVVQWVDAITQMYQRDYLKNKDSYYGQLFLHYIQNEETALAIARIFRKDSFLTYSLKMNEYLFENVPLTIQKKIIKLELIANIPLDYAKKIDVETFLECYKLLKSNDLLPAIQSHYDEIIKINPKIILDMLITPYASISEQKYKLLIKAAELLPDAEFLKLFIKYGYNLKFICDFEKEISYDDEDEDSDDFDDFDEEDENEYHDKYDYF